jgi:predicted nuclease with TOPRIM domain
MASQPKKSAMKKDTGEKGDKSRPVSSKLTKKESTSKISNSNSNGALLSKSKQEQILKENSEYQIEIKRLSSRNNELTERLKVITNGIVEQSKLKGYKFSKTDQYTDLNEIPLGKISELTDFLVHGKDPRNRASMETRVEELETRITHLNMELSKMLELRINLENGLEDIQNCDNLFDVQNRVRFLLYEASK